MMPANNRNRSIIRFFYDFYGDKGDHMRDEGFEFPL